MERLWEEKDSRRARWSLNCMRAGYPREDRECSNIPGAERKATKCLAPLCHGPQQVGMDAWVGAPGGDNVGSKSTWWGHPQD